MIVFSAPKPKITIRVHVPLLISGAASQVEDNLKLERKGLGLCKLLLLRMLVFVNLISQLTPKSQHIPYSSEHWAWLAMTSNVDGDHRIPTQSASQSNRDRDQDEYATSQKSRFRFKSSKRKPGEYGNSTSTCHSGRPDEERHHRHHHRTKRRKRTPSITQTTDEPALYDGTDRPTSSSTFVDPDVAFRESLFDAMADDEGALFWEGVYGQPIHTYPHVKEGPDGKLERMTDEEYTAYVRAKMYEKTHQHLIEEKARRNAAKKERQKLAEVQRKAEKEGEIFRREVEESLKRGEERRTKKAWSDRWETYTRKWEELGNGGSNKVAITSIPWPVESGKHADVKLKDIERFFLHAPSAGQPTETQLAKILKVERFRWHPDKIQQKLGGQDVDKTVMQAVTVVFQVIDQMWSDLRDRKK